jgi:outer membrane protein, heavy metal efflux system
MLSVWFRPCLALGVSCIAASAIAQPAPTLREAAQAAWELSPQARVAQRRVDELDARSRAASSFLSGAPSVGFSHRTDRIGSNAGMRETEAEVSAPLWLPRVREATASSVEADRAAFVKQQRLAQAKVAAEVRNLAGQLAIARIERELAERKVSDARTLATDVARRVRAGDSARVDQLQAEGVTLQAQSAAAQADAALGRRSAEWKALTGLSAPATLDEVVSSAGESLAIAAAQAQVRAAQAKLRLTDADRADAPEVGVGVSRERAASGAPNETSLRVSVRVPLGNYSRNGPKLAAARAELAAAEAELEAVTRQEEAERQAAMHELEAARRSEASSAQRLQGAIEVHRLIANSYRLGESDLPTRLRAEAERFDAQLAHARAQVEARRAISKLNQTQGVLP